MFGKIPKMLHPPVLPVEKLCVPLPPKCIYPRQRNIVIREMVRQSHTITTVSRSLTSTKMARLNIVVSFALENDPRLIAERKAREEEERKKAVAVKLETLTQHEARIIGCENLCNSTMRMLYVRHRGENPAV